VLDDKVPKKTDRLSVSGKRLLVAACAREAPAQTVQRPRQIREEGVSVSVLDDKFSIEADRLGGGGKRLGFGNEPAQTVQRPRQVREKGLASLADKLSIADNRFGGGGERFCAAASLGMKPSETTRFRSSLDQRPGARNFICDLVEALKVLLEVFGARPQCSQRRRDGFKPGLLAVAHIGKHGV
jgi:hypothetical protein